MKTVPRVSIVIPTYNLAPRLPKAIDSVFAQTFDDWELLVVDDSSTDDTKSVVDRYTSDDRVRYLRHPWNRGPSAARNTGIAHASGELIGFLDADDRWAPPKLEAQVEALGDPEVGVCCVAAYYLFPGGRSEVERKAPPFGGDALYLELLFRNSIPASASGVMMRRGCFREVGPWDESLRGGEDRDLWLRLALRYRFAFLPEPLVYIDRERSDRATEDALRMAVNREAFLRKRERDVPERFRCHLPRLRRHTYGFMARSFFRLGGVRSARWYALRALLASARIDGEWWQSFVFLLRSLVPRFHRHSRTSH